MSSCIVVLKQQHDAKSLISSNKCSLKSRKGREMSPCIVVLKQQHDAKANMYKRVFLDLPTSRSRIASGERRSREPRDRLVSLAGIWI
jgi:hypothetical protein